MNFMKKEPIILVVSGKANSGKDTVCSFINNYIKLKDLKCINLQFSSYIKMYARNISGWDGSEDSKPRTLLQELGTDIIRNKIDENFFINRIKGDIKVYSYYFDVITISDARLPHELDDIYNSFNNVFRINLIRPNFSNSLNEEERKHITEIALDNYSSYEYSIVNDGSLNDLNNKVISIINEVLK